MYLTNQGSVGERDTWVAICTKNVCAIPNNVLVYGHPSGIAEDSTCAKVQMGLKTADGPQRIGALEEHSFGTKHVRTMTC